MAKEKKYYLGLDVGTSSSAFAVTDTDYKLLRIRGTDLWGVNLFDEASLKKERRTFRSTRRRRQRKHELGRVLLEDVFRDEIYKVDNNFYQRLYDSHLHPEDKHIFQKNSLVNDSSFDDKEYHKNYPTIYHLRMDLLHTEEKKDIRLLYLSILNMMKRRGHFLSSGSSEKINTFSDIFGDLANYLEDTFDFTLDVSKLSDVEAILKDMHITNMDKYRAINKLPLSSSSNKKQIENITKCFCGLKSNINLLFNTDKYEKDESVTLSKFTDDVETTLRDLLGEEYELINHLREIYTWTIFSSIMIGKDKQGNDKQFQYLSEAMVNIFEQHHQDLMLLKNIVKKYLPSKIYDYIFNDSVKDVANYVAYSGKHLIKKNKTPIEYRCNHEDFLKFLTRNVFDECKDLLTDNEKKLYLKLKNNTLLRKQRGSHNLTIPYQINLMELKKILNNQARFYPFLKAKDENGYEAIDKIISIFTFRVPYYIGPLNTHSPYAWIVRDTSKKITPWNFNELVDETASAENFIKRMTNRCTYLIDANVVPKNSLVYQKYLVLNDLNNLRVNDVKLSVSNKQKLYTSLVMKYDNVSLIKIKSFMLSEGMMEKNDILTGLDQEDKSKKISLKTYNDFIKIGISEESLIENIVNDITLFGAEKNMLHKIIKERYGSKLNPEQVKKVSKLSYMGWGNFSTVFLNELEGVNNDTGEVDTILNFMWKTNNNLMQLLSNNFDFRKSIEEYNTLLLRDNNLQENIDSMKLSQPVNKMIRKTFTVVEEVVKIVGNEPKTIFIETTRSVGEKKRTVSRKKRLEELYKESKLTAEQIYNELEKRDNIAFQSKRVYLYFIQQGKCMYTGNPIDIQNIFDESLYDIDHIYPKSKVQDDSVHNNLVLVEKQQNSLKGTGIVLEHVRRSQKQQWKMLLERNFITKEKYNRLVRNEDLTVTEIDVFVARQLVETSQAAKAIASLLQQEYPNTRVVYVKAENISNFRRKYELIKSRELNNHHHAKDAYLSVVVGNVYDLKFSKRRENTLLELRDGKTSLNKIFDYDVDNVWKAKDNVSIKQVKEVMKKNTPKVVREVYEKGGGLFNQTINKKTNSSGVDTFRIPLKGDERIDDFTKYGYYGSISSKYFALVEYYRKNKKERKIIPIYAPLISEAKEDLGKYCEKYLGIKDGNILIPKIGINTVFEINGKEITLASKSDNRIVFNPKFELIVSPKEEALIHHCVSYVEKVNKFMKESSKNHNDYENAYYTKLRKNNEIILEHEKISNIFVVIRDKILLSFLSDAFVGGNNSIDKLKNAEVEDLFKNLSLYQKARVVHELVKAIKSDAQVADLTDLGIGKSQRIRLSNAFINNDKYQSVKIISYSPTGFFRKVTEIK